MKRYYALQKIVECKSFTHAALSLASNKFINFILENTNYT